MIKVLKASAGSGKTYSLVEEYINLLIGAQADYVSMKTFSAWHPNVHRTLLAITFTNNSTNEMKERIVRRLFELAKSESELADVCQHLLGDILNDYSMFRISTIDSFFAQIIRSFTRDLGIDTVPAIELDDMSIREQAVDNILASLNTDKANKPLLRYLIRISNENMERGANWNIRDFLLKISKIILSEEYLNLQESKKADFSTVENEQESINTKIKVLDAEISNQFDTLIALINSSEGINRTTTKSITEKRNIGASVFSKSDDERNWFNKGKGSESEIDRLNACANVINRLKKQRNTLSVTLKYINITGIVSRIRREMEQVCQENDSILISTATHLISTIIDSCDTPFIYERVGVTTDHYMIDEFQDTSRTQWNNIMPLLTETNARGKESLIVGDVKQSIYRWRNGDWNILSNDIERQFEGYIKTRPLNINRRSCAEIIEFNNMLYSKLIPKIDSEVSRRTGKTSDIASLYNDMIQEKPEDIKTGGSVSYEFHDSDNKSFYDTALDRTAQLLCEYSLCGGTRAVLVRKKYEASLVAKRLIRAGIPFYSSESLRIDTNPAVQFVISIMNRLTHSNSELYQHLLIHYANSLGISALTTDENILPLIAIPLTEIVPYVARKFHLAEGANAANRQALDTLHDTIRRFATQNEPSLIRFLGFWETHSSLINIPLPEDANAVRIITIHSSKGLQFDHVILLMAENSWKCGIKDHGYDVEKYTFIDTPYTPNNLPATAIDINSKACLDSDYEEYHRKEYINCCIDNVNTLYVATTRAKIDLHVIAQIHIPDAKSEAKKDIRCRSFSVTTLLMNILGASPAEMANVQDETHEAIQSTEIPQFLETGATDVNIPLKINYQPTTEQTYGIVCHKFLSLIKTVNDVDSALRQMVTDGDIKADETAVLSNMFAKVSTHGWFAPEYTVYIERDILHDGQVIRPDRVNIIGNQAIIIDYKFGERNDRYNHQVSTYCQAYLNMGYNVEGYIYYANDDYVERVI